MRARPRFAVGKFRATVIKRMRAGAQTEDAQNSTRVKPAKPAPRVSDQTLHDGWTAVFTGTAGPGLGTRLDCRGRRWKVTERRGESEAEIAASSSRV